MTHKTDDNRFSKDTIKVFLNHKFYLSCLATFSLILIAVSIAKPYILSLVFDKGIAGRSVPLILHYTFCFFLIMVFTAIISVSNQYIVSSYANTFVYEIKVLIISHVIDLPKRFFDSNPVGDIVTRVDNDVQDIRDYLLFDFGSFYQSILSFAGATVFIGVMQWRILVANLAILPLMAFALHFFKGILYKSSAETKAALSASNKELLDGFRNINELKATNFELYFTRRVFEKFRDLLTKSVRNSVVQETASSIIQFTVNLTYLVTIGYGGYLIIEGQMTVGMLLSFLTMRSQLIAPIRSWSNLYTRYFVVKASMDRLNTYYCQQKESGLEITERTDFSAGEMKSLRFDNVFFSYTTVPSAASVFLDNEFAGGEWIGIKGKSGIGKTTLLRLTLKLVQPSSGEIFFGNRLVRSINNREWRDKIGYVSQKTLALNDTIRENILMGRGDITEEQLRNVLRICCLEDVVAGLPHKMDTTIDENGAVLSEGMLKRLMLARVVVKPKRILLLDEFFSSLDLELAREVAKNLRAFLPSDVTVITVSHRETDFEMCDRLIDMNQICHEPYPIEHGTNESILRGQNDNRYRD